MTAAVFEHTVPWTPTPRHQRLSVRLANALEAAVRLISEIESPSNPAADRVLMMHYYAEAGIPWYLLVEPRPELTLQLFRLDGERYVLHGEGRSGMPLHLDEPMVVDLDPAVLV